ncbi:MAG: hypothetical protein ACOYNZ_15500 [Rhodoferax sp.]
MSIAMPIRRRFRNSEAVEVKEMKRFLGFIVFGVSLAACGSSNNEKNSFTLYQSSVMDPNMRVRVAVFDAPNGKNYNTQKCRTAQDMYQKQADTARFWCEQGKT